MGFIWMEVTEWRNGDVYGHESVMKNVQPVELEKWRI